MPDEIPDFLPPSFSGTAPRQNVPLPEGTQPDGLPYGGAPLQTPPSNQVPPFDPPLGWAPPNGSPTVWMAPQQWGPPPRPPSSLPAAPREYSTFWQAPGIPWWKPVLAVVLTVVGFVVSGAVIGGLGVVVDVIVTGKTIGDAVRELQGGIITPYTLLANSVALALLIPLAFLLSRLVGQKGGWMSSVVGRIRWPWLLTCLGVSIVAVGALFVVSIALEGWGQQGLSLRPGWWWLLIGVLLVTPFQAAGEEYVVRGLVNRAVASLIPARVAGIILGAVVSSVVFMLIHGAGDIWLNITYFSMGMLFSFLAWSTGGLEAPIAMHAANNLVAFAFVPFQDFSRLFDRSVGTGDPTVLLQLALLGGGSLVIVWLARRAAVERVGPPQIVASMP